MIVAMAWRPAVVLTWLAAGLLARSIDPRACDTGVAGVCDSADVPGADEGVGLVQLMKAGQVRERSVKDELTRITVKGTELMLGNERVVALGGNYVMKAQPYYPPEHVVRRNARQMANGAKAMKYKPSDGRKVVPVVRLGNYMEGAMPHEPGVFDADWQARLEATVKAFADEGVYVFLDIHQDAFSTTNGGAGFPYWFTAKMQETSRNVPYCHIECTRRTSYITTPDHPLASSIDSLPSVIYGPLMGILKVAGVSLPKVEVLNDTDPWLAYSVGGNAGDPRSMNVGNINMRANNNDAAWSSGTLTLSTQVMNAAWRFYRAHKYKKERERFFDPYMTYVRYLLDVYERHPNVIAVELLNEPPFGGLPSVISASNCRTLLFDFYAAVLEELEGDAKPTTAPIIIEDVGGSSFTFTQMTLMQLLRIDNIHHRALKTLRRWSDKNQLIYEYHWYADNTLDSLIKYTKGAVKMAASLGNPPIYLGEYWFPSAEGFADILATASELGCSAVTYWQYVDLDYTHTGGWFKYPKGVPADFLDNLTSGINENAWEIYAATVADNTYWGAYVCGAAGGQSGVLELVPEKQMRNILRLPCCGDPPPLGFWSIPRMSRGSLA